MFAWVHPFTLEIERRPFVVVNEGFTPETLMARQELVYRDFFSSEFNASHRIQMSKQFSRCLEVLIYQEM